MAGAFQYDVLLSHRSKDKAVVRAVAERLHGDGLKVYFDEWVLKPGSSMPGHRLGEDEGSDHLQLPSLEAYELLELLLEKTPRMANSNWWPCRERLSDVLKVPATSQRGNVNEMVGKFGGGDQLTRLLYPAQLTIP